MKISFCLITKGDDELSSVKRCVASVRPYIDTVHIQANSDKTVKTKKWCEDNGFDYQYRKWTDSFAEARNANWEQVPKDTDWIFWMDSDDVLVGGEYLRDIALSSHKQGLHAVFMDYWYGCKFNGVPSEETLVDIELKHNRERLLRPGSFVWKNRLHETPVEKTGINYRYSQVKYSDKNPIAVLHLNATRDEDPKVTQRRIDRNKRLLEMQLDDERRDGEADPRTLLYLMKIYQSSGSRDDIDRCIEFGEEYLQKSGWDEERAVCLGILGKCYASINQEQKAIKCLLAAIDQYPYEPIYGFYLARVYHNLGQYKKMKHWLIRSLEMDDGGVVSSMDNLLERKILAAELLVALYTKAEKNPEKAFEAMSKLYELSPTESNKNTLALLEDMSELNQASRYVDKLSNYLYSIGQENKIPALVDLMPKEMAINPFAVQLKNKYSRPKIWEDNEIAYYASFGQKHFEEWTPDSLKTGIAGSETAVISLSKEWAKLGYKVTVYGEPGKKMGVYDGVTYLPWYFFNPRDKFSTLIQWRSNFWADKVSAKRFYVDLHDIWHEVEYVDKLELIDGIFVKSKYQRKLAPSIPDEKFVIISNGINV